MYKLEIGKLKYKYLASPHVIAIITPNRKIRIYPLEKVQSNPKFRVQNGTVMVELHLKKWRLSSSDTD